MFQYSFTGVVKHLIILNVIFFFGSYIVFEQWHIHELGRSSLAAFMPGSPYFQPYQIFTYMFMHGGFMHLAFNMLSLFIFGPMVEATWGTKKFLGYYLFCGVGAYALYLGLEYWRIGQMGGDPTESMNSMLGASGAIFGVMAAFMALFPNMELSFLFFPIPIRAKYFILAIVCIEWFLGAKGSTGGVAHMAHFGGALFGLILIAFWYWKKK